MLSNFHQLQNTIGDMIFNTRIYSNCIYPPHMHKSFELIYVCRGKLTYHIENHAFVANENSFVLFFPYQIHSWETSNDGKIFIVVFSDSFIKSFAKLTNGCVGQVSCFSCSEITTSLFLKNVYEKYPDFFEKLTDTEALSIKSCLYAVCYDFLCQTALIKSSTFESSTLITRILEYIARHFNENISLHTIAADLGYSYQYISRIFNDKIEIKFKTLLNQYRYEYSRQLLLETSKSITEIAYESGFQSIRNFNFVFSEFANITPSEYRSLHQTSKMRTN